MGCHNSKQARHDILLSPSPLRRRSTSSLPDDRHLVSLTSSTFGSLPLDLELEPSPLAGLADARAWSDAIVRKIPRTPTETPPGEPEPVDAWELMAGLHGDFSPLVHHRRSFSFYPAEKKGKAVIFYFTSLRGVRRTYEDCCYVRAILREYGVRVDERDVSMDAGFKEEARGLGGGGEVALPRVLVGSRDLGGGEEVRRMHEGGELGKVLEGWKGGGWEEEECEGCGDVRFVPCGPCSGSCRVYVGEEEEGWRRCSECNENGIVRCPICCLREN